MQQFFSLLKLTHISEIVMYVLINTLIPEGTFCSTWKFKHANQPLVAGYNRCFFFFFFFNYNHNFFS